MTRYRDFLRTILISLLIGGAAGGLIVSAIAVAAYGEQQEGRRMKEQESVIKTRIGDLQYEAGYPTKATSEKLYDEMDFQRATQA